MLDLPSSQDSLVQYIGSVVVVCEILVPQPGIKPMPSTVEAQNLSHWTTKGSPLEVIFDTICPYRLQSKPSLVYYALTLFSCYHYLVFMWPDPPETTASTAWSQVLKGSVWERDLFSKATLSPPISSCATRLWDLSSSTRDWTRPLAVKIMES